MSNIETVEELLAEDMKHHDYQLALCENFSFLDNFTSHIGDDGND